jgi:hypothetical protein
MRPLERDQVCAIVPCHRGIPVDGLLDRLRAELARVVLVSDGVPPGVAANLESECHRTGSGLVRLERNSGKGHAIAAAIGLLRGEPSPPQGVLVVDADGQHPPEAVPEFLGASAIGELVIGNRFSGDGAMPPIRRLCNRFSSAVVGLTTGAHVPDSQCGMRLLRGRALNEVQFPSGRMEAETRHLKRCLRSRVAVAWIPIPAIYDGHPSSFRPVRDSLAVMRAAIS